MNMLGSFPPSLLVGIAKNQEIAATMPDVNNS
jgi:hypothetical protein